MKNLPPLYEDDVFKINFSSVMSIPKAGSFANVFSPHNNPETHAVTYFITCREVWQWRNSKTRLMVFVHQPGRGEAVAAFIRKIEMKMNVRTYSRMGRTVRNNCSWICISPCWYKSAMTRSLFSALLRSGLAYKPEKDKSRAFWTLEFMRALRSCIYLRRTVPAFRRFVNGHRVYKGHTIGNYGSEGWDYQFYYALKDLAAKARENKLRKLLVKRTVSK